VAEVSHDAWQQTVPGLVRACADAWELQVGPPYEAGAGGYVAPADAPHGPAAVLKLIFPHRESRHEADALERWNGDGAVRLLARDDARSAMLLERCEPGTKLADAAVEDPVAVFVELLPRLWKATTSPFRSLTEEAAWWTSYLRQRWEAFGRPFDRRLVDAAIDALTSLSPTQGEQVLLHQDLHGANVLAAAREPWLVIDPKPLVGEREFGLAPVVRSSELGHSRTAALRRLDRLTSDLGLDRDRARGWAIGQTIAWSFDPDCLEDHAETAGWLLAAR
jgi:streptomycin 6-kinase